MFLLTDTQSRPARFVAAGFFGALHYCVVGVLLPGHEGWGRLVRRLDRQSQRRHHASAVFSHLA